MGTYIVTASEDSYVRVQVGYRDANYNEGRLVLDHGFDFDHGEGQNIAYIKFSLADVPSYTDGCFLRLAYRYTQVPPGVTTPELGIGRTATNWSESTVTANTSPSNIGSARTIMLHDVSDLNTYFDIDVSDEVAAAIAENATDVSFRIYLGTDFGEPYPTHYITFNDSETDLPPKLVFMGAQTDTREDYVRDVGMSVTPPKMAVYPYPYGPKPMPAPPTGWTVRNVTEDTYVDCAAPTGPYGHENILLVQSGAIGNFQTFLKFDLTGITAVRQAILRLPLCAYTRDGPRMHLVLCERTPVWDEYGLAYGYEFQNGNELAVRVYHSPEITGTGLLELDVTPIVQNALMSDWPTQVAMSIDQYEIPTDGRSLSLIFASREAPIEFKPHLVLDTTIPADTEQTIPVDGDVYLDSDHTVQSILWSGHDLDEMPIRQTGPNTLVYLRFDVSDIDATIKTAKLRFTLTSNSSFGSTDPYNLRVVGHGVPLDIETAGYNSYDRPGYCAVHMENHELRTVTTTVQVPAFSGSSVEVEVDVTTLLHYTMHTDNFVVSLEPDPYATTACLWVAGRVSGDGAELDLVCDPAPLQLPPAIDETDGTAVVRCTEDTCITNNQNGLVSPLYPDCNGAPAIPEMYESGYYSLDNGKFVEWSAFIRFAMSGMPSAGYAKIDKAVLHLPFVGIDPSIPGGTLAITHEDIQVEVIVNSAGAGGGYGKRVYRTVTVMTRPYDMQIDILEAFQYYALYSLLQDDPTAYIEIGFVFHDNGYRLRFGTIEGGWPACLDLCWDDFGLQYYVDGATGDDSRDGLHPDSAWRHMNYASQQVPAGKVLNVTTNFTEEPTGNRIAPVNSRVKYRLYGTPNGYGNYVSTVEFNLPGDPV